MPFGICPDTFAIGHQWGNVNPQNRVPSGDQNTRANIAKILGYFPFLGLVTCVLRIVGLLERDKFKEQDPFYQREMTADEISAQNIRISLRAIGEFLSLGWAIFVADVIADCIRASK